ncbi:MAG: ATP-binding protein [Deltaproteobacteria bacterium]|nr:ATP-binding protein [Deltaproteobacteria bacterium]
MNTVDEILDYAIDQEQRRLLLVKLVNNVPEPTPHLRSGHRRVYLTTRRRLFLGPPGTGKSHLVQAIGLAAIQQGYRVLYRETHALLDEIAEAAIDGSRISPLTAHGTLGHRAAAHYR